MNDKIRRELEKFESFFTSQQSGRRILIGRFIPKKEIGQFSLSGLIADEVVRYSQISLQGRLSKAAFNWNQDLNVAKTSDALRIDYSEEDLSKYNFIVCENGIGYLREDQPNYGLYGIANLASRARIDGKTFDDFFTETYEQSFLLDDD